MIDRVARKQTAQAIRHFATGQITNKDFIKRYPTSGKDPAIWALDDTVWCLLLQSGPKIETGGA